MESVTGATQLFALTRLPRTTPDRLPTFLIHTIDFLENKLVSFYECESHFFRPRKRRCQNRISKDQPDPTLYWRTYKDPQPHCSGKIMVCGHTPQLSGMPANNGHSICIDTWVYGQGWLSCLDVGSGTIWQANEAGETRSFLLDV